MLLLVLALAGGPLLTGCQSASEPGAGGTPTAGVTPAASGTTGTGTTATGASGSQPSTPTAAPTPAASGSQIPAGTPSGPLRLFCTPRTTLNPLAEASASYQEISRLVYEGLFAIDATGLPQPVLAEADSLVVAADGLSLTLRLAERTFHAGASATKADGTGAAATKAGGAGASVTAADVAASYTALRTAGTASAWYGRLPDITNITAADARTVHITLSRPQPDIAWQLTFPVLPAAALSAAAASPLTPIAGTGPYRIAAYTAGKGLTLLADDSSEAGRRALVRTIQVAELPSLHDALRAFERDGLDLVSLPSDLYPDYALRNGLKLERYATDQYVFLAFRTEAGALLSNAARLAFVQAASRAPALTAGLEALGVQPAAVPVHPDSPLWTATALTSPGYLALYQPGQLEAPAAVPLNYPAARQTLVILAPQDDRLRVTLAERLKTVLAERGVSAETRLLAPDAYQTARTAGQYDILVAQAVTTGSADPRWLLGQAADPAVSGSELLSRTGRDGYPAASAAVDQLFAAGTLAAAGRPDLLTALGEAARLGPCTGIGFRTAALASGSRVIGQPRPQAHALYEGIEELWLWST